MKTKELGVTDTCFCGQEVVCGKGSRDQLQWQVNGKAHYNYDTKTGKSSCNKGETTTGMDGFERVVTTQKENPVNLAEIDLDHDVKTKICKVAKDTNKVLKTIEWQIWEDLGFSTSPARVGMYMNIITKKMLNIPNLEQIIEDVGDSNDS